jgi:RNA polymerase sigma factor (sigma-70 family)
MPEVEDPEPDGAAAAEAGDLVDSLRRAVGTLPDRERAAVLLRVTARLTFAEVGEALGVTDRGAAQVYERGVARLKRRLGATDEELGPRRSTHGSLGR